MTACVGDELSGCDFGDVRLTSRIVKLASSICDNPEASINAACGSFADSKGAYRFLQNDKVKPEKILASHLNNTWLRMGLESEPILAIQDTTDLIYTKFPSIKGLGQRLKASKGYEKGVTGLLLHTTLAASMEGVPLGIAKQTYFTFDDVKKNRGQDASNKRGIQKDFPITEKASYRWLDHLQALNKLAEQKKKSIIHVADREADIFEFLQIASTGSSRFVVRSSADRLSQGTGRSKDTPTLSELIAGTAALSTIEFEHKNKIIQCEVRSIATTLRPPQRTPKAQENKLSPIPISVVDVHQVNCGENPIHWRLLTNLPVDDLDMVLEIVKIYRHRWAIECFHRILKSGFHIEEARLANRQRIENFATIISIVSWYIFWLYKFGRSSPSLLASTIIDEGGIKVLKISAKKLKVKVSPELTIGQALLVIARLGGFLGRKGDGDPGMKSIWRGWRCLTDRIEFLEGMTCG